MEKESLTQLAERYINETGVSVFLTGKAGTGKTTFLKHIVETTPKRHVVLAPTGVAAVNAGGVTIHSFFQLPLCPFLPDVKELVTEYQMPEAHRQLRKEKINIIRTLDLLIIDEISMVRADLLDAVDDVMRRYRRNDRPFGGVQVLMTGDVQQLPPVVTDAERPYLERVYASPFFFSSKVMQRMQCVTIELQHVYRQADAGFLDILNAVRDGRVTPPLLQKLNSRLDRGFEPEGKAGEWIRLTTHNWQADGINRSNLEQIDEPLYESDADIDGNFPYTALPAERRLQLKVGAQVMFIRNDSMGRWYNGKVGVVTDIDEDESITVVDPEGNVMVTERETWNNMKYELDRDSGEIRGTVDGTFTQFPLRLAWAVTIHKSQGLTFDRVIIDAASAFTFGQVYVALSRCRTLEGIVLTSPISATCLFDNACVSEFCGSFPTADSIGGALAAWQSEYHFSMLADCFDLSALDRLSGWVYGLFRDHLKKTYPKQTERLSAIHDQLKELLETSRKFRNEITRIKAATCADANAPQLAERVSKACGYFLPILTEISAETAVLCAVSVDNKQVKKDLADASKELLTELGKHLHCMGSILKNGFSVARYLADRTDSYLNSARTTKELKAVKKSAGKAAAEEADAHDIYADNRHPELIEPLTEWRTGKYLEMDVPAYVILSQKALLGLADACPRTKSEFLAVNGVGETKWKQYGPEILDIIRRFSR